MIELFDGIDLFRLVEALLAAGYTISTYVYCDPNNVRSKSQSSGCNNSTYCTLHKSTIGYSPSFHFLALRREDDRGETTAFNRQD